MVIACENTYTIIEMNIFILDLNPRVAAQAHCDKHVVKMLLESVQLLYTAHWVLAFPELTEARSPQALSFLQKKYPVPSSLRKAPHTKSTGAVMRPAHVLHPCAVWTRQNLANYMWLCTLAKELAIEFQYRYNHLHSCEQHVDWLTNNSPPCCPCIQTTTTPFAIAMDPIYYCEDDPVASYRNYYNVSKRERGLLVYTGRDPPSWLIQTQ
jgi:hypothetical protein